MASKKRSSEPSLRIILERIDEQGADLKAQRRILEDHGEILKEHTGILKEHTGILKEHTGILREHTDILKEHSGILSEHTGKLNAHGSAIDALGVRVDSQTLLLEDMRSQNRATIEALEATRVALEERIERLDQDSRGRDALLEVAVRDLKVSVQQNSIDLRDLAGRVKALARLEDRVAAIERRLG